METVHVILWVVIVIYIASVVFNMVGMSREAGLAKKRFIQGAELSRLATMAATMEVITERKELRDLISKDPTIFNDIANKSEKDVIDSIKKIYKE